MQSYKACTPFVSTAFRPLKLFLHLDELKFWDRDIGWQFDGCRQLATSLETHLTGPMLHTTLRMLLPNRNEVLECQTAECQAPGQG
jgi:hypothetical protein